MTRQTQQLYDMALRLLGQIQERPGAQTHPFIEWAHELSGMGRHTPDETAWCSSGLNALAFLAGLSRSKSAAARSWIRVGEKRLGGIANAQVGDIVIIRRGGGAGQEGPENLTAPGHVFVFESFNPQTRTITGIGGNQRDAWTRGTFGAHDVLDVRVLTPVP